MQSLFQKELIVDLFAGGGGASTGIEQSIGRHVDIAINHDPEAIAMHKINHPNTQHYIADIFEIDPIEATKGSKVGLLWASPACTHFSKARGKKPVSKQLRSLAWVVLKWASKVRPRIIMLENVEEFKDWSPVDRNGNPIKAEKGATFKLWISNLKRLGYQVEFKELIASEYGAPTSRKRLFVIARCDGKKIIWPSSTHGKNLKPMKTAADCIDWSIPCQSIFERDRQLADATMQRIAKGVMRYVLNADNPHISNNATFISTYYGHKSKNGEARGSSLDEPLKTQTTENRHALVSALLTKYNDSFLIGIGGGAYARKPTAVKKPMGAIPASGNYKALVTCFLTEHANGSSQRNFSIEEPLRTQCANVKGGHFAAVAALLIKYYGNDKDGCTLDKPLHTIPTHDRFGLVLVKIGGEDYVINDIGMRMLQPHELFAAQGFPSDYIIRDLCRT